MTRSARERYALSKDLLAASDSVVLLDLRASRVVTQRMNEVRRAEGAPGDQSLRAGPNT